MSIRLIHLSLAGLAVGAVACGSVKSHNAQDAAPDVAIDALDRGLVTVTVLDPFGTGTPSVGTPVVFFDPDGTMVGLAATGSDGKAQGEVKAGASVTAVQSFGSNTQMTTVLALKPGDNLTIGQHSTPVITPLGTFSVSFTPLVGATSYTVYGPCGSTSVTASPATLTINDTCKTDPMELQVQAVNNTATVIGYVDKSGVTFTPGGSAAMPTTWATFQQFSATYSNLTNITNVSLSRYAPDTLGVGNFASGAPMGATLMLNLNGPVASAATVLSSVTTTTSQTQQVIQPLAGNATSYSLDLSTSLLPWLGATSYDLGTHKFSVPVTTTGTSGDTADLFAAEVAYSRPVGTSSAGFTWIIFGPPLAELTLPTLPPEVGDVNAKSTDTSSIGVALLLDSDAVAGWDAVRPDAWSSLFKMETVRGTTARSRISQSGN